MNSPNDGFAEGGGNQPTGARNAVTVTTGSRLHFGLTRVRREITDDGGKFGGVGVMIDSPQTILRVIPSDKFTVRQSPDCDAGNRLKPFADSWAAENGIDSFPCSIELLSAAPQHSGLGSGTQLAHAVSIGIHRFLGIPIPSPQQIAARLDRGNRSMIGSYGFAEGGLLVDKARRNDDEVAELACRVDVPESWRILLVSHRMAQKKFGIQEKTAFENISANPSDPSWRLEELIAKQIVPATQSADFERFCSSVYEYGKLSGEFYTDVQGGIYNGSVITSVVETLLSCGARGVGQSSWGPTVFAWCDGVEAAEELRQRLQQSLGESVDMQLTAVRNLPALVTQSALPDLAKPATKIGNQPN